MAALRPLDLRFTASAYRQLQAIETYIHVHNPAAAQRVGACIRTAAEMLRYFPEAGRPGLSSGTREWVVRGLPYIVVYEIVGEPAFVAVLGVFHGAQSRDI